ncbi:hypothetical protein EDC52_101622 [Biostraticola tofi]|uniref:Uncharacterized protein n=1 Tax=Biostraticola tofi TaxID=466109 RepID=A0A4R3Z502_9GAMM|nr:hypothetical protein EDC52_101622 [Biostraticola tofi]
MCLGPKLYRFTENRQRRRSPVKRVVSTTRPGCLGVFRSQKRIGYLPPLSEGVQQRLSVRFFENRLAPSQDGAFFCFASGRRLRHK